MVEGRYINNSWIQEEHSSNQNPLLRRPRHLSVVHFDLYLPLVLQSRASRLKSLDFVLQDLNRFREKICWWVLACALN